MRGGVVHVDEWAQLTGVYTGGASFALSGGPTIYSPQDDIFDPPVLVGSGHLRLDGVDDHAIAAMPVRTDRGFAISRSPRRTPPVPRRP